MSIVVDRMSRGVAESARLRHSRLRIPGPPHLVLIAVAIAYCLLIAWRTPQAMTLTYDEAVYASQVAGEAHATRFTAHRARGMTLLVAPIVSVTESVFAFRVYLSVLAGLLMYGAFRPWLAVFGRVGGRHAYVPAVAAALFASLWMTILYGTMAYPNAWLAFALIAGVGFYVRAVSEPTLGWGVLAAVAVAFAAATLIRPTDALAAAGPLLVAPVVVRSRRRLRPLLAILAGLAVGWTAWIVEAFARFDGPVERLRLSAQATGSALSNAVPANLHALDGPVLLCGTAESCAGIDPSVAAWWLLLPILVVVGLVAAARSRWLAAGGLATASALAAAALYLFYIDYAAPRFLLPAYGLLAIPAAGALIWLTGRRRVAIRAVAYAAVVAAFLAHTSVQLDTLDEVTDRMMLGSWRQSQRAELLREHGVRAPCLYWGAGAIELSYQLKCRSWLEHGEAPAAHDREIAAALERGDQVVVMMRDPAQLPELMAGWRRVEMPGGSLVAYLSR